jgi:F-type H+-transporting ATPase subunit epsilon
MKVFVLTPQAQLFEGDVKSIKLPGTNGQFEILDRHAPVVSSLQKGTIYITDTKGSKHKFPIKNGFIEVANNEVNVLVRA